MCSAPIPAPPSAALLYIATQVLRLNRADAAGICTPTTVETGRAAAKRLTIRRPGARAQIARWPVPGIKSRTGLGHRVAGGPLLAAAAATGLAGVLAAAHDVTQFS